MKPLLITLPLVTFALLGCAAQPAPKPVSAGKPAEQPAEQDGRKLLAREATRPLQPFSLTALEGTFIARIDADAAPQVATKVNEEGVTISDVSIPLGTPNAARCILRADNTDPAALIRSVLNRMGKVRTAGFDVDIVHGTPVFMGRAIVEAEGQKLDVKIAQAEHHSATALCFHLDAGYLETFRKMVWSLVGTARVEGELAPTFKDVSLIRVKGGHPIGFQIRQVWESGGEKTMYIGSSILGFKDELRAFDFGTRMVHDKGNDLVKDETVDKENGAVVARYVLTRKAAGEYTYEGEKGGKAFRGTMKPGKRLTTTFTRAFDLKKLKTDEARFWTYRFTEGDLAPVEMVFKRAGGRSFQVTTEKGYGCELDENGICAKEIYGQTTFDRAYLEGSL
jgi:hypothetical protein